MFLVPNQVSRYVTRRTLVGVGGAFMVLSAVIVLSNYVELTRQVNPAWGDVSAESLLGLALLESPGVILIVMPFAFLFGVLLAFMNLNRRSELIALRAAGVSAWRFVLPAAAAAAVIGVMATTLFNPVASDMNAAYERLKSQLLDGPAGSAKPIWLRQGDRRRQVIIQARSNQEPGVHLKDVTIYIYDVAAGGRLQLSEQIKAHDAILHHHIWSMTGVSSFRPGGLGVMSSSFEIPSDLSEQTALERFGTASGVPFWSLPAAIVRTEAAGISATAYRLQYQQLLSTPLMYAAMSVLAAAFSLRLLRLGGIAQFAGSGIALGFAFFFFNQLCSSLGKSDVLPPWIAAWSPPVMALLVGITLLCYTEDG